MAISEHIKTAHDARVAGTELQNAAAQIAVGVLMTGGKTDVFAVIEILDKVGEDYLKWSEGKKDDEEIFVPTAVAAAVDQTGAEVREFLNKNFG